MRPAQVVRRGLVWWWEGLGRLWAWKSHNEPTSCSVPRSCTVKPVRLQQDQQDFTILHQATRPEVEWPTVTGTFSVVFPTKKEKLFYSKRRQKNESVTLTSMSFLFVAHRPEMENMRVFVLNLILEYCPSCGAVIVMYISQLDCW